jgi:hypothetical protein
MFMVTPFSLPGKRKIAEGLPDPGRNASKELNAVPLFRPRTAVANYDFPHDSGSSGIVFSFHCNDNQDNDADGCSRGEPDRGQNRDVHVKPPSVLRCKEEVRERMPEADRGCAP